MLKTVHQGKTLLIKGPQKIELESGQYNVLGANVTDNKTINIPLNKTYPIEIIKTGRINIDKNFYATEVKVVEGNTIPESWNNLVKKAFSMSRGTIIINGAGDTGKSSLTTYLGNKLLSMNKTVSILDCDVGQSEIGPPCTIGLAVLEKQIMSLNEIKPLELHFVGSHTPGLHLVNTLSGIKKLATAGLIASDYLIVNTTGWVSGNGGRLLKKTKFELLNPDLIVLIQNKNEIEHLAANEDRKKLYRVNSSNNINTKFPKARKENRELMTQKLFSNSNTLKFSFNEIFFDRTFLKTGKKLEVSEIKEIVYGEFLSENEGVLIVIKKPLKQDTLDRLIEKYKNVKVIYVGAESKVLVGLADSNRKLISLGIIEKIDYARKNIFIKTPIEKNSSIKYIQFGSVRYNYNGKEAGFVEPGYF